MYQPSDLLIEEANALLADPPQSRRITTHLDPVELEEIREIDEEGQVDGDSDVPLPHRFLLPVSRSFDSFDATVVGRRVSLVCKSRRTAGITARKKSSRDKGGLERGLERVQNKTVRSETARQEQHRERGKEKERKEKAGDGVKKGERKRERGGRRVEKWTRAFTGNGTKKG